MEATAADRGMVLIAAPDTTTRDAIAELLVDEGYRVRHAHDGPVARAWLLRVPIDIDVALVDVALEGGPLAVLESAVQAVPAVRVALLTNTLPLDARRHGEALGVAAVLNRPLDLAEVLAVVANLVARPAR